MFCIYQNDASKWTAEYVYFGKVKLTATGKTPIDSLNKLFEMVLEDDEAGTVAETDGTQLALPSNAGESGDCSQ